MRNKHMKKHIVVFFLTILYVLWSGVLFVNAESAEQLKEKWRERKEYPVRFLNDELSDDGFGHLVPKASDEWYETLERLGATNVTYALNPPKDMLKELSSKELTELFLKWPWLHLVNSYDTQYNMFFSYAEVNSDIFYELLGREDGYRCILEAYRDNPFDIVANNVNPYFNYSLDLTEKAEIFGCKFIQYYHQHFTQEEYELACEIMEEKASLYAKLSDEADIKRELVLDPIDPPLYEQEEGLRANYYTPEKREEIWAKAFETSPIGKDEGAEEEKETVIEASEEKQNETQQSESVPDITREGADSAKPRMTILWVINFFKLLCVCCATFFKRSKKP